MSITSYKLFLNFFLPIIPQGIRLKYVYWNIWRIFQLKNDIQFISYEQVTLIVNIGKTISLYIYIAIVPMEVCYLELHHGNIIMHSIQRICNVPS